MFCGSMLSPWDTIASRRGWRERVDSRVHRRGRGWAPGRKFERRFRTESGLAVASRLIALKFENKTLTASSMEASRVDGVSTRKDTLVRRCSP